MNNKEKEKNCGNGQGLRVHRDGFMSQEEHLQSLGMPRLPGTGEVAMDGEGVGAWTGEAGGRKADSWLRKETRDARKSLCPGEVTIHTESALPWPREPGEECSP